MRDKKHLTENGLQRIINIRALMNKKTSITYYTYPLVIDVPVLPLLKTTDVTPEWLAGFTDAEGCFFLNIRENKSKKGYWVTASFSLYNIRPAKQERFIVIKVIQEYLSYGNLVGEGNKEVVRFKV